MILQTVQQDQRFHCASEK